MLRCIEFGTEIFIFNLREFDELEFGMQHLLSIILTLKILKYENLDNTSRIIEASVLKLTKVYLENFLLRSIV